MGQEIVYCIRCATRVAGHDFQTGKAFRVASKVICAACMPVVLPTLTPEEQKAVAPGSGGGKHSTSRIRTVKPPVTSSSTRMPPVRPEPPARSKMPLILGSVAAVGVLIVAGVLLTSRSEPPPAAPGAPSTGAVVNKSAPPAVTPPPVEEKKEEPTLREAREAIERAREKTKTAPADLDAQVTAWEEAARKAALTPLFKDATAGLQEAKDRRTAARPAPVEKPVAPAPVEPPLKPPTAVSKAYLARWEPAMAKAASREIEGALADLGRAAAELGEDDGKRDALADVEELKRARTTLAETAALLKETPVGQTLQLTLRGDDRKRIEGAVVATGPSRVEVRQGETAVYVEWSDLSAASLRPRNDEDRRSLAILCLLEGDRESAERLYPGRSESIPARYWDYSKEAAARLPKLPPREAEARRLFYAAEREFAKMDTLPAAVAKYRALAEDYADTGVVKGDLIRIQKRGDAGKDYLLMSSVLKGSGTFALAAAPRVEVAWASKADSDPSIENCVEGEFAALPDVAYRAWALVGACCLESFTFYLQTSEGTDLHPKTKQKTSIDPGAGFASPVKLVLSGLKKTHEEHKIKGSKTHPKIAARWEWIPIPLPKYAGPGLKKIRLISDQGGFSVGAIAVTSTRTAPPPEDDLKEEAAKLKVSAPPIQEGKPWRPLFDGKSLEFLKSNGDGWRVENGAVVHIPGPGNAAQTRQDFEDVEVRIRFELKDMDNTYFKLRQGEAGGYMFAIGGDTIKSYEGKPHELIFVARGDQVTATIDGKPASIQSDGAAKRGCLQFSGNGQTLRLLSIETR